MEIRESAIWHELCRWSYVDRINQPDLERNRILHSSQLVSNFALDRFFFYGIGFRVLIHLLLDEVQILRHFRKVGEESIVLVFLALRWIENCHELVELLPELSAIFEVLHAFFQVLVEITCSVDEGREVGLGVRLGDLESIANAVFELLLHEGVALRVLLLVLLLLFWSGDWLWISACLLLGLWVVLEEAFVDGVVACSLGALWLTPLISLWLRCSFGIFCRRIGLGFRGLYTWLGGRFFGGGLGRFLFDCLHFINKVMI